MIKSLNIFLSIFGYTLYCDPKEKNNLSEITIVDEKGLAVGSLLIKEDGTYTFNMNSIRYGNISGDVNVKKYLNCTKYYIKSTIAKNNSSLDNKLYDEITDRMEITIPNEGYESPIQIDNRLFVFKNDQLVLAFNVVDSDRKILFFSPNNEVVISKDSNNQYVYRAKNTDDNEIVIYYDNGVLEYECFNDEVRSLLTGSIEVADEENVIEAMSKLALSMCIKAEIHSVKSPIFFVKEFRNLCSYGEEMCIFNNVASITLGQYPMLYNKDDMVAVLGFVPWELPNTPVINEDGTVLSPREKKKSKNINKQKGIA